MLLITVLLTLITLCSICNGFGHDIISMDDYDDFHHHLIEIKKRETVDTILAELGSQASLAKRFDEYTYRRVVRLSREKLDEREQNRRRRYIQRRQRKIRVKHSADDNLHKKPLSLAKTTSLSLASKTFGIITETKSNECIFDENEGQYNQCLMQKAHKENIFKELKALGGERLDPNIKDTSAYYAALKRHRKEQAFEDEKCLFPKCDPDGIVKRIALKMKKAPDTYPDDSNRIWFNITTLTQYNFEEAAVLYYVGRIKNQYSDRKFKSRFYYYTSPTDVEEYTVLSTSRALDNITGLMTENENWETFDITALVRNWIENPEKNYGIMIKLIVEDADGNEEYGEMVASTKPPAYLEISNTRFRVKEKRNSVVKHKTPLCDINKNHKNSSCCLYPFTLSFDDLNWDWIIAPKRIQLHYCSGYCTAANLKGISHSQVLYNKKNLEMCCAPEASDPVDILYSDNQGNLQLKADFKHPKSSIYKFFKRKQPQTCSCLLAVYSTSPNLPNNKSCHQNFNQLTHRKYSSASTLEIDDNIPTKEILDQLIKKYNLFVYLGKLAFPQSEYCQPNNNSDENSQTSRSSTSETTQTAVIRNSDHIFLTMNAEISRSTENNPGISYPATAGHRLETLKGCCGVPARLSGFFSWCIQLIILLISVVVTALIFVHIGGYGYFLSASNNNNETEIIKSFTTGDLTESLVTIDPQMLNNETIKETIEVVKILEGNETEYQIQEIQKTYQGPFEQISEVNLKIGNFMISLLPVLRTINIIYIIFCVLWLASLGCLLLSLKLELLDLVIINCLFLVVAVIAFFVQSIIVGILIFYEKALIWQRMLVIGGTVGGFIFCFIFGILALWLLMIWYKYIDYSYNRKEACVCLTSITECVKGRKHGGNRDQAAAAAGYTIQEATTHSALPYIDEGPVTHFSNF